MLDVYRKFYGLTGEPFRLGPDHRFSLQHSSYANARAYLEYAIFQGEGFVAITGAPGTGKTTLISEILSIVDKDKIEVSTLTSTQLESRDLLHMVAHSFGIHAHDDSKASLLLEIESFLVSKIRNGHRAILIVDEAQGLSKGAIEELRLLANLQHKYQLLLQIILVGQEKLLELIQQPAMEHLHQRLVAATSLEPLGLDESIDYIEHRLSRVAWKGDPGFDEDALRLMYRHSGGIPRRINLIVNRLFLYGGMNEKHHFAVEDAQEVIKGLIEEYLLPSDPLIDETDVEARNAVTGTRRPRHLPRAPVNKPKPAKPEAVTKPARSRGKSSVNPPDLDIGSARRNQPQRPGPERKHSNPTMSGQRPGNTTRKAVRYEPEKKKGGKGFFIVLLLLAVAGSAYLLRDDSVSQSQLSSQAPGTKAQQQSSVSTPDLKQEEPMVESRPNPEDLSEPVPVTQLLEQPVKTEEPIVPVPVVPEEPAEQEDTSVAVAPADMPVTQPLEQPVKTEEAIAPVPVVPEEPADVPVTQPVETTNVLSDDSLDARREQLRQAAEQRFTERQVSVLASTADPLPQVSPPPAKAPVAKKKVVQPKKKPRITAAKVRRTLLQSRWSSAGKPASLLPSDSTSCREKSANLICSSAPQNVKTQYGLALYKVETTLSKFSAEGHFELTYRTLVRLVDGNADRQPASDDAGWQVTEYSMSCTLSDNNRVACLDGKGITREYRRVSR